MSTHGTDFLIIDIPSFARSRRFPRFGNPRKRPSSGFGETGIGRGTRRLNEPYAGPLPGVNATRLVTHPANAATRGPPVRMTSATTVASTSTSIAMNAAVIASGHRHDRAEGRGPQHHPDEREHDARRRWPRPTFSTGTARETSAR